MSTLHFHNKPLWRPTLLVKAHLKQAECQNNMTSGAVLFLLLITGRHVSSDWFHRGDEHHQAVMILFSCLSLPDKV